eukprot:5660654-Amphidinium_carterae.2
MAVRTKVPRPKDIWTTVSQYRHSINSFNKQQRRELEQIVQPGRMFEEAAAAKIEDVLGKVISPLSQDGWRCWRQTPNVMESSVDTLKVFCGEGHWNYSHRSPT